MSRGHGMTLVELLIVLAMVGVLAALSTPLYVAWRADTQVQEAAVRFARDVDATRHLAKRTGIARTVAATGGATTYTVAGRTVELGPQIAFTGTATTSTTFAPPYGTKETPVETYTIAHRRFAAAARTVRIVGVTGEAVIRHD
jgi:prepilin-type N-terminal cleavage/methylation domain-containing protein